MPHYIIISDTQTQGQVTERIWEENYPDALLIMDNIVDEIDGHFDKITNPPDTLTFDQLESGLYGEYQNCVEKYGRWQNVLASGWFYTGDFGSEIGQRCGVMSKLDPVMFHY